MEDDESSTHIIPQKPPHLTRLKSPVVAVAEAYTWFTDTLRNSGTASYSMCDYIAAKRLSAVVLLYHKTPPSVLM